ncbi:MAG TPA: lytic murein transglycosylase, partial [Tahibacter sp.]|nr:lytic murein transglycosylase [Tahibacter sp.]
MTFASLLLGAAALLASPAKPVPEINVADVDRFYAIYDAAGGKPTQEQLQQDYLDRGSAGLAEFAKMRRITGESIAKTLADKPAIYTGAKQCAAVLPAVKTRLADALAKLAAFYPGKTFPPVTLAIGRGKPVGTANASGVMIGLEALCAVDFFNLEPEDRFVHVIAHEYGHVLQPGAQVENADESVLKASLLEG